MKNWSSTLAIFSERDGEDEDDPACTVTHKDLSAISRLCVGRLDGYGKTVNAHNKLRYFTACCGCDARPTKEVGTSSATAATNVL